MTTDLQPWKTLTVEQLIVEVLSFKEERCPNLRLGAGDWIWRGQPGSEYDEPHYVVATLDSPAEEDVPEEAGAVYACAAGSLALAKLFQPKVYTDQSLGSDNVAGVSLWRYLEDLGYPQSFLIGLSEGYERGRSGDDEARQPGYQGRYPIDYPEAYRGRNIGAAFRRWRDENPELWSPQVAVPA